MIIVADQPHKRVYVGIMREITLFEFERGLLYEHGKFIRLLEPGRYRFWWWENVMISRVNLRQVSNVIPSQEMLTADNIEVRVSLVVQYAVTDPVLAAHRVENYTSQLYMDVQLALRQAITVRTLDQVMTARDELSQEILAAVSPVIAAYGMTIYRTGIRDITLPKVVRDVILKEVEAERGGRADLIKARHEVAAARARANTAKLLTENPMIARLQELDTLVRLAEKDGHVVVVPANLFGGLKVE